MSDREYPYDPNAICDECGHVGAYDIMGDLLCYVCLLEGESDVDKLFNYVIQSITRQHNKYFKLEDSD